MKLKQTFVVGAPAERVWAVFQDVPTVARCLPGAELTGGDSAVGYTGTVTVKLGPMSATFEGTATVEADPATRSGRISGSGFDRAGGSRGRVDMSYAILTEGADSAVALEADIALSGTAAQFGRPGLIDELARRMVAEFSTCLERVLAAPVEEMSQIHASDIKGIRMTLASLWGAFVTWVKQRIGRNR